MAVTWRWWVWVLASVSCLLGMAGGLRHENIVISSNLSGSAHSYVVDGASVMSAENYRDQNLVKTITVMPESKYALLSIQVVYMDIKKTHPCEDHLKICQLTKGLFAHTCSDQLLKPFCGTRDDMFPSNHFRAELPYIQTLNPGRGILIEWRTSNPHGSHRGFQLLITAIYDEHLCSAVPNLFKCGDGRCVSRDLHCDGFAHCIDGTDETVNCSGANGVVPASEDCSLLHSMNCPIDRWRARWFGLAIPMAIVMVLVVVAIFVKVRKQLCFPPPSDFGLPPARRRRRFQRGGPAVDTCVTSPDSHGHIVEPVMPSAPPAPLGVYPHHDHTMMLLPPPYSPPQCIHYEPTVPSGDPPPRYDDSFSPAYSSIYDPDKPDSAHHMLHHEATSASDAHSPLPNSHFTSSEEYRDDAYTSYR